MYTSYSIFSERTNKQIVESKLKASDWKEKFVNKQIFTYYKVRCDISWYFLHFTNSHFQPTFTGICFPSDPHTGAYTWVQIPGHFGSFILKQNKRKRITE
jgi:hypothetical protein